MDEWEKLLKTPLREKKPTLRRWTDPTNHVAYNKKCVPGENYGILTGRPNNLFVIDLDVYKTGEKNVSTNTFRVLYSLGFSVLLKFEIGLNRGSIK